MAEATIDPVQAGSGPITADLGRIVPLAARTVGGQTMPVAKMQEWEQRSGVPLSRARARRRS